MTLNRIIFDGHGGAKAAERWDVGHRIRDVEEGPDGSLWMLEDANPGGLYPRHAEIGDIAKAGSGGCHCDSPSPPASQGNRENPAPLLWSNEIAPPTAHYPLKQIEAQSFCAVAPSEANDNLSDQTGFTRASARPCV